MYFLALSSLLHSTIYLIDFYTCTKTDASMSTLSQLRGSLHSDFGRYMMLLIVVFLTSATT